MKSIAKKFVSLALCACMMISSSGCGAKDSNIKDEKAPDGVPLEERNIVKPEDVNIDTTISISPLNASVMNGGKFEGWGTSLCWWANRVGYSDELAQKTADLFFGEDGLHLNIMRYNIGGGDDPAHNHITRTDSEVPGWLYLNKETGEYEYDYTADKNQLNVLQRAYKAAGDDALVEVFSNSPPYFMTVSGCSSGGRDGNVNNLKDDSYRDFAEYLAHVTDYIQNKLDITVTSVAPMNEPNTNFWWYGSNKQEGCHFDEGESQSKIIELTYDALKNYDLDNVIISASDETSTEKQINEYLSYSDKALTAIGRINTHSYDTSKIGELGELARKEGFNMWMSEVDGSGTVCEGEMGAALWLGEKIISDINSLSPSAWVLWQVIDNHISKDGYNGKQDSGMVDASAGFWGTAVCDHDNNDVILTQKYYAFGQFTRFIRPGSTIIHCGGNSLAAYDSETKELAIVVLNKSDKPKTANISLSQMKSVGDTVECYRTSGTMENGEHWAALDDIYTYGKGFVAELAAQSITTYVVGGVELGNISLEAVPMDNPTVTGSTPWNNCSDTADKVVDGDTQTFFDGVEEGWLEIDRGDSAEFNVIAYAPRTGYEGRMLGGKFYGSKDGKKWTEIYEVTSAPASGFNYAFLDKAYDYRYIRYDVPSGGGDFLCNIAEVSLYKTTQK